MSSTIATPSVAEIFADLEQGFSPGAAYGIVRDGVLAESGAFGHASLEHRVRNRPDTVFYIASTSKQFVAACVLCLEADGRLDLDADIRDHLPELTGWTQTIRVHHLLHHTSGIRDKYSLAAIGELSGEACTVDAPTLRLLAAQRTLNFEPGTRMMYSNSGYFLLAQIVERISGQGLREFAAARIFEPLGMTSTRFRPDAGEIIPDKASGYAKRADGWALAEYTWPSLGPGGVFTTIADLVRWDRALGGDHTLQPADLHERMLRTRPLAGGAENSYAAGLMHGKYRGATTVGHAGGVPGYSAEFIRFPELRTSFICLANSSAVGASARTYRLADVTLAEHLEPEARPESAERGSTLDPAYAGTYLGPDNDMLIDVEAGEEGLVLKAGGAVLPIQPLGQDRGKVAGREIRFAGGALEGLLDDARPSRRVAPSPDVDFAAYAGAYRSDELAETLRVEVEDGRLVMVRGTGVRRPLRSIGDGVFAYTLDAFGQALQIPVVFRDDHLALGMSRATDVRFKRVADP